MSDKKILKEKVINFFFRKEEYKSLSNFWECDIIIIDKNEIRIYNSGESCFHGEKFIRISNFYEVGENRKNELLEYSKLFLKNVCSQNGSIIKKMGRKFILNKHELDLWYNLSIDVQKYICKYKFENYDEVKNDLYKSKGKILIHPAMRCNEEKIKNKLWEGKGIVINDKIEILGKNMLGKLWMELRD